METQVRTPQQVFMQPQRLRVPLFQRPYVWNEDDQWEPLWTDVARVAERLLGQPYDKQQPHFLGAVVLQQLQNPSGTMQERTIIDGQQRLTTLQVLLDALRRELKQAGVEPCASRIEDLVANAPHYCKQTDDRFKVWPTNRDREAFNEVMAADSALVYSDMKHRASRLVQAHQYFAQCAREWLESDKDTLEARAIAVERAVRELIQMVVIDLSADENAQEIFETLNARGAQLTAADLIKNFIFQRLIETGADVEAAYARRWKDFEMAFWETEVSAGRVKHPRSSVFLNQWLITKTGEEILAREVFYRFKTYADFECDVDMTKLLEQIHRAGRVYQDFVNSAGQLNGPISRLGLFAYRTGVMESEVIKPLVLFLLDPDDTTIPEEQLTKALEVIESWLVRRMLVRATSKSYAQVVPDLIARVRKGGRDNAGDLIEHHLRQQSATNWYWPDDVQVRAELRAFPAYRRLSRARARMVLEAIEDHERGWQGASTGLGGERVARGRYTIEHVLPRKWSEHWPLAEGGSDEDRDALIDTFGNLTLLTAKLNSGVSNGPWTGADGKRKALEQHDVLMLNRRLLEHCVGAWDEAQILARSERLIDIILAIWSVPEGHRVSMTRTEHRPERKVEMVDLIGAGLIHEGATLYARRKRLGGLTATVLPDGALEVKGVRHTSPSAAAKAAARTSENGWKFWLLDLKTKRSLKDLVEEYVDQRGVDADLEA
jgi:hypothetical protein